MKLRNLTITNSNGWSRLSITIESHAISETELWFSVPTKYQEQICVDRYDPFVVGLLFPAMAVAEDIHVEGNVSNSLLHQLNQYAVALICSFSPIAKPIRIHANPVSQAISTNPGAGSGFTGGVDSFYTFYNNNICQKDSSYKINKLLFFNVGSHGPGNTPEKLKLSKEKFLARYNYLKNFPDDVGLDFIPIDSNLHTFHPWGHQLTHSLTSAAATLIFQKSIRRYYYSSSGISYHDMYRVSSHYRNYAIGAYCDPILLPLLSTDSMQLIADGYQHNRTEKTIQILDYPPVKKYLNVCINDSISDEKNCSVCPKCCRTLVTLEATGRLEEFTGIFDIDAYRNVRSQFLANQIAKQNTDPFARYALDYYKQSGLPLPSPLRCRVAWIKHQIMNPLYSIYRRYIRYNKHY